MRSKDKVLMRKIISYINEYFIDFNKSPTMREIAGHLNISPACVYKYIEEMREEGLVTNSGDSRGVKTRKIEKFQTNVCRVAIVGSIACGKPLLAEENIESYVTLSRDILGSGKHFILRAKGSSMVNAGINDGDYVIVREQNSAEEGQIVVALIGDETTLKRYYIDKKRKKVRLHPENDSMEDMYFDNIIIQGIAIKVIKDLM